MSASLADPPLVSVPADPVDAASPGTRPEGHPGARFGRVGVLLMNLGTPEGTDYWSMRRYLKEFLSDRRVIEVSRWIWWPILNLIILTKRPGPKGKDYASIWNKDLDEGPLKTITRAQAEALQRDVAHLGDKVAVDWSMRYGLPRTSERIQALLDQGCDRILAVPLYPQYAAATVATACDQVFASLQQMRWQPTIRVAAPWHDDPVYIRAVEASMRASLAKLDFEPEVILVSFHGVPRSYLERGDPYYCQCVKTYRLLREAFGWPAERFRLTFQSRFGNEEWLKPYTDETVMSLAKAGVKSMAIVAPGFTADCLETLEELDGENRHYFEENGGQRFAYLPCLNEGPDGMAVIRHVVERELQGWV